MRRAHSRIAILSVLISLAIALAMGWTGSAAVAQDSGYAPTPPGGYGYAAKRPIFGGACPNCIWGPIGEVFKAAMKPYGYDVQVCYNCNLGDSPRYVALKWTPHALADHEKAIGDPPPPKGVVDMGVTNTLNLWQSYAGLGAYKQDGPQPQLRLLAYLEDPHFVIVAVKSGSGITDLAQIKAKHMPVRLIAEESLIGNEVLNYYGLNRKDLESWGGKFLANTPENRRNFDVMINAHGNPSNNEENKMWEEVSQRFDLNYLELPPDLRDKMASELKLEKVDLPLGYLRGVTRPIPSVARDGQAIYGRADMPDDFAYAAVKAIDLNQDMLKYLNHSYFYNVHTVWKTPGNVPLHPAAERYYREMGYMK